MNIVGRDHPIEDELLWRYCTAERFGWIVGNQSLYFASANQFTDPFEGAVAVQLQADPADPRYAEMEPGEHAFFELKRLTKLNCWHRADYESAAMWALYSDESKGVAICSTLSRLRKALRPFRLHKDYGEEDVSAGPVEYVDLTAIRLRGAPMLGRFFYKHRAFEWEREFRLAISLRMAEENVVEVPELGISVSVNLAALVDHIVIGPALSVGDREKVVQYAQSVGLGDRLRNSSLLGRPRYV